jgi:tetratricopeptide (TPR) repeat protein
VESHGNKQRLLATITAAREREHELLAMCDDSPPPEPGLWTVKDHLAHLSAWRLYAARVLDAVRSGRPQDAPPDDELEVRNARIYEENQHKPADQLKSEARSSYDTLEAAIAACSEEDLGKPHPRAEGAELWQVVPGNGHSHLGEHLMFWHLEQGDEEAAEVAQQWVYDINRTQFPEPKSVAAATYNLGCFYARVGRADEAMYRFKQAFELDPSLKKLAETDPDLDPIRHHPELAPLIGSV